MFDYYPITPLAKPRLTKADAITMRRIRARQRLTAKQQKREALLCRWLAFIEEVRLRKVYVPDKNSQIVFLIPMPKSWTQRMRDQLRGYPHRGKKQKARKNDIDNLLKALMDAIFGDDSAVWDIRGTKLWWDEGGIFVIEQEALEIKIPFDRELWLDRAGVRSVASNNDRLRNVVDMTDRLNQRLPLSH